MRAIPPCGFSSGPGVGTDEAGRQAVTEAAISCGCGAEASAPGLPAVGHARGHRGRSAPSGPLPHPRVMHSLPAYAGCHDSSGRAPALCQGLDPLRPGRAPRKPDREADLSRRLLPHEGARAAEDRPHPSGRARRAGPRDARRAAGSAGRGPEDREPRRDGRLRAARHLRRHPCPSDHQPLGPRADEEPSRD